MRQRLDKSLDVIVNQELSGSVRMSKQLTVKCSFSVRAKANYDNSVYHWDPIDLNNQNCSFSLIYQTSLSTRMFSGNGWSLLLRCNSLWFHLHPALLI